MKRFLINVSTDWCGEENQFRAVAENAEELEELGYELACDNLESYGHDSDMAEYLGYNLEEMNDVDWNDFYNEYSPSDFCDYSIEEFTGTDEEWEEYGGVIY